jgi:hypothetical protein
MCYNYMYRGEVFTTSRELFGGQKELKFHDPNDGSPVGSLQIVQIKKDIEYSMAEYLQGGIQIGLNIGIDFTGSNGDPSSSSSYHYYNPRNPDRLNHYQQAILAIGNILLNYDDDKLVFSNHLRYQHMVLAPR